MDRQTQYAYVVPFETDFLYAERFAYESLGLLALDLLGTSTLVSGLGCIPTTPASLQVKVQPGRIYSKQDLEDTAWGLFNAIGGLPVDTNPDHQIVKQGLYRDTTTLATMPAPVTAGQSINYLIEAAFSEVDDTPVSLPFVSAVSPYPPIAPNTLNTVRRNAVVITVKAGVAATTGTQTTPAVDANNVGLYVVTVANGQTQINAGNITLYPSAPFITETLTQKISTTSGDARYLRAGVNARTLLSANTTFYVNSTTGNDSNSGLVVGSPWLTLSHALAVVHGAYDLNGFVATIQLADGTYTGNVDVSSPFVGATASYNSVVVNGNNSTPSNVTITAATASTATLTAENAAAFTVQNCKVTNTGTGAVSHGLYATTGAAIKMVNCVFGATTGFQLYADRGATIQLGGSYTVNGNAVGSIGADTGGSIQGFTGTCTVSGTPTFSTAFAVASRCGSITVALMTYTGAATGSRYSATLNGVIDTGGGGASFFSGSSAGSTATGGQYN